MKFNAILGFAPPAFATTNDDFDRGFGTNRQKAVKAIHELKFKYQTLDSKFGKFVNHNDEFKYVSEAFNEIVYTVDRLDPNFYGIGGSSCDEKLISKVFTRLLMWLFKLSRALKNGSILLINIKFITKLRNFFGLCKLPTISLKRRFWMFFVVMVNIFMVFMMNLVKLMINLLKPWMRMVDTLSILQRDVVKKIIKVKSLDIKLIYFKK